MCLLYACKTFLRVRNGDVASQQGVLGGSWTRLGSEARWTSQMPCSRVAIADWLEGGQRSAAVRLSGGKPGDAATWSTGGSWTRLGSEAPWTKSDESQMPCGRVAIADWLEGGQRPAKRGCVCRDTGGKPGDAASATSTHAHGHLLMTIDIDGPSVHKAPQARRLSCSWALVAIHNMLLTQFGSSGRICNLSNLLAPRAPLSVQGPASPYMCHAQVAVLSKPFSHTFLRGVKPYCLLSMRTRLFKRKVTKSL